MSPPNQFEAAIYNDLQNGIGRLGIRVFRAATTFPAAIAYDLFTIAGGNILVTSLVGEVTVNCGAGANATLFQAEPGVGLAVALDDGTADLNGALVGILIAPTGAAAVASALADAVPLMNVPVVCKPGTISMTMAAATLGAGALEFTLHYVPLEPGVTVVIA